MGGGPADTGWKEADGGGGKTFLGSVDVPGAPAATIDAGAPSGLYELVGGGGKLGGPA